MPNITITAFEATFLKEQILRKYCKRINENFESFSNTLTGTLRHYELISDNIIDYIENEEKIISYLDILEESTFKIGLLAYINSAEKKIKKKLISQFPAISADIIRKLVFYGSKQGSLSFRDLFIYSCYAYIGVDRILILKKLPKSENKASNTIPPPLFNHEKEPLNSTDTIPPFKRSNEFKLTLLNDDLSDKNDCKFQFSENPIILNRTNLDQGNLTITSKMQAVIYMQEGEWYIENRSELNTTFLQIKEPIKLKDGDILFMGNKRFKFKK